MKIVKVFEKETPDYFEFLEPRCVWLGDVFEGLSHVYSSLDFEEEEYGAKDDDCE